jgi:hypothetical protein
MTTTCADRHEPRLEHHPGIPKQSRVQKQDASLRKGAVASRPRPPTRRVGRSQLPLGTHPLPIIIGMGPGRRPMLLAIFETIHFFLDRPGLEVAPELTGLASAAIKGREREAAVLSSHPHTGRRRGGCTRRGQPKEQTPPRAPQRASVVQPRAAREVQAQLVLPCRLPTARSRLRRGSLHLYLIRSDPLEPPRLRAALGLAPRQPCQRRQGAPALAEACGLAR